MTARSRSSGVRLLVALAALGALSTLAPGCRSRCAGMDPALEVGVRVSDSAIRAAIHTLTVIAEVRLRDSDGKLSNADSPQTYTLGAELADERSTSFVIRPGSRAAGGFSAAVTVTARDASGVPVAASSVVAPSCTGDACNFAEVSLTHVTLLDGRRDGPHDAGREARYDRGLDGPRDGRGDPPTSACKLSGSTTVEIPEYCPKRLPQWVNVWQYATGTTGGPTACSAPNGNTYPLVGEPSAPFFNLDQCGKQKLYKLSPQCDVLVVGTAYCGDKADCSPFDRIAMAVDHSGDGKNWTPAAPSKLDLTKTGSECGPLTNCTKAYASEKQVVLPSTAAHLRLTADGAVVFQACVYQAAGVP